jgi:hypothetical protein
LVWRTAASTRSSSSTRERADFLARLRQDRHDLVRLDAAGRLGLHDLAALETARGGLQRIDRPLDAAGDPGRAEHRDGEQRERADGDGQHRSAQAVAVDLARDSDHEGPAVALGLVEDRHRLAAVERDRVERAFVAARQLLLHILRRGLADPARRIRSACHDGSFAVDHRDDPFRRHALVLDDSLQVVRPDAQADVQRRHAAALHRDLDRCGKLAADRASRQS